MPCALDTDLKPAGICVLRGDGRDLDFSHGLDAVDDSAQQAGLRENGTFLSLVVIYLANLMVLVALLCAAEEAHCGTAANSR